MVDFNIKKNIENKTIVAEVESDALQLAEILVAIIDSSNNKPTKVLENELKTNEI